MGQQNWVNFFQVFLWKIKYLSDSYQMLNLGFVDITTLRGPKQLIVIDKGLEWSILRVYLINYYNSLLISR